MYQTFREYREQYESNKFDNRFTRLCEGLAESGLDFEQYWEQQAVPMLLQSETMRDEEELLNEFLGNMFNNIGKMFGGGSTPSRGLPQTTPWIQQNDPHQRQAAAQQKKLSAFQAKADQMVTAIKQRFAVAMKDFLKAVTDDAKNQNNPHMWQVAKSFYQKVMSAAQPAIDQFAMKAKAGTASYANQFNQQVGQMQQGQQAANQDAIRQRGSTPEMQQKLADLRLRRAGLQPNNPQQRSDIEAMREKLRGGYDPFAAFSGGSGNNTTFGGSSATPVNRPANV